MGENGQEDGKMNNTKNEALHFLLHADNSCFFIPSCIFPAVMPLTQDQESKQRVILHAVRIEDLEGKKNKIANSRILWLFSSLWAEEVVSPTRIVCIKEKEGKKKKKKKDRRIGTELRHGIVKLSMLGVKEERERKKYGSRSSEPSTTIYH